MNPLELFTRIRGTLGRIRPSAQSLVLLMALATAHREDLAEGISGLVGAAPFPYLAASLTLLVFGGGTFAVDGLKLSDFSFASGKKSQV